MRGYQVMIADCCAEAALELQERLLREPEIRVVGAAGSCDEACEMARRLLPDVVLMDVDAVEMNGLEATRRIKRDLPQTQIVILTAFPDTGHVFKAIRAGAMSCLTKSCSTRKCIAEVNAVMAGEGSIPPAQVVFIQAEFDRLERQAVVLRRPFETLSQDEADVLTFVAQGKTNPQIARMMDIESTTIKGHVTAILKKLHVNGRVESGEFAECTSTGL